jgi:uncharacterized protein (DUF3820 family)
MYSTDEQGKPSLPFGKHKGQELAAVPTSYLQWCLRECKLSSGLRSAAVEQLQSHGIEAPAPPPRRPGPRCREHPAAGVRYSWQQDSLARRHVRRACGSCNAFLGFAPSAPPFTEMADAATAAQP